MSKLIGIIKSGSGTVHAVTDKRSPKALCGYRHGMKGNFAWSGRSRVTCEKCKVENSRRRDRITGGERDART